MSFSSVQFSPPSADLFKFPPSGEPQTLQPPTPGSMLYAPPFTISQSLYTNALDVRVPITIATIYAITVTSINKLNLSNGNKPWPISKTRPFFTFVVLHNVLLAVYSAWTFIGMFSALSRTLIGFSGSYGLANTIDSLCKIHGPRGLGNAVTYNASASQWTSQSAFVSLSNLGTPKSTEYGRFWNEGLAFYGWIFYLSKFYEVLDTFIILAKGKRSSTLQTYHHAGAMMCMWSGIRFMSPPIWMFVFVNSGIHTLMYTYYTLTAFNLYIPQYLKRSLTTLQIIQFLVGSSYAALHSFITYTTPVSVPILMEPAVATTAATMASPTPVGFSSILKDYLLHVVGASGPVLSQARAPISSSSATIEYRTENQTVHCIDTSGQTFAIWLNVLYLAPLTILFVRFFIRSYIFTKKPGKAYANGSPNGHMNGSVNGHANGHSKGKINGKPW